MANKYLVLFKRAGSNPDPTLVEGWFSISIEANDEATAQRWAEYRVSILSPWLKDPLELVRVELHNPSPEWAGPYRGLIVQVD